MNKDQVKGNVDQAVGKTKEVVGKTFNNKQTEAEGIAQNQKGKVREAYGDAKEKAKDYIDKA
jgi:uncharacterized protein YjbJ (UPF0337 family)